MNDKKAIDTDIIIAGAGPAGMSAALWCKDLGLRAVLLDRNSEPGGQMLSIYNRITNYPGIECENGSELAVRFMNSLWAVECEPVLDAQICEFDVAERTIILSDERRFRAGAIIIATGVSRRKLGAEGEEKFIGKGILASGVRDITQAAGKKIAVIGGGDAAVENALLLAETAEKLYLIHRGSHLSARSEFVKKALSHPRIDFRSDTIVRAFRGDARLESVQLRNVRLEEDESLAVHSALIRIGVTPNTGPFGSKLKLDDAGYIVVNDRCETSLKGVFAAGDVANPTAPTISSAAGMGTTAAKAAFAWLQGSTRV